MALVNLYLYYYNRGLQCQHVQIKCQNVQIQVLWKRMSMALVTLCDRGLGGFNGLRLVPHPRSNRQAPLFFTFIWKVLFVKLTFGKKVYWSYRHSTVQVLWLWIMSTLRWNVQWSGTHCIQLDKPCFFTFDYYFLGMDSSRRLCWFL